MPTKSYYAPSTIGTETVSSLFSDVEGYVIVMKFLYYIFDTLQIFIHACGNIRYACDRSFLP
jgi:hypothetical protein